VEEVEQLKQRHFNLMNTSDISGIQINKQDTLTAGDHITIVDNVTSSTGGGTTTETSKVDVVF